MPREKSVADLMRAWRQLAGLNTLLAGEELGLSSRSIEDIEQGRTRVDDTLSRRGIEAMLIEERLRKGHDMAQRNAALAAVAARERKVTKKRK